MRNVFRLWVLGSDVCYANVRGLSSFGESIVSRVKVLAFLNVSKCVLDSLV